ncbi:unnamed protein product [Calicophoron daubneyi]
MVDLLNVNFLPTTLYLGCPPEISKYIKNEAQNLAKSLDPWSSRNADIRLMHVFFMRYRNQLRHFIFFKSFELVRRGILHICSSPQRHGIERFCALVSEITNNSSCLSLHSLDHLLVCLIQLHRLVISSIGRVFNCWKHCEAQFISGHFTKMLLIIVTLLATMRSSLQRTKESLGLIYKNLRAVRDQIPGAVTWLSTDTCLPLHIDVSEGDEGNLDVHAFRRLSEVSLCGSKLAPSSIHTNKISNTLQSLRLPPVSRKTTTPFRAELCKRSTAQNKDKATL